MENTTEEQVEKNEIDNAIEELGEEEVYEDEENVYISKEIYFAQPFETSVKITDKCNAKGEPIPEVRVLITRKHEDGVDIETILDKDITTAVTKARNAVKRLKELG